MSRLGINFDLTNDNCAPVASIDIGDDELQEINCRADAYVSSLNPEPANYRLVRSASLSNSKSSASKGAASTSTRTRLRSSQASASAAKKKRKKPSNECVVQSEKLSPDKDRQCALPEGTKLLRPKEKLVEIVARVIANSPDGLLTVKSIYQALQALYPYYLFMDNTSILSWKSSVRHALYQRWFIHVIMTANGDPVRNCYWAFNETCYLPKHWAIPEMNYLKSLKGPANPLAKRINSALEVFLTKHNESKTKDNVKTVSEGQANVKGKKPSRSPRADKAEYNQLLRNALVKRATGEPNPQKTAGNESDLPKTDGAEQKAIVQKASARLNQQARKSKSKPPSKRTAVKKIIQTECMLKRRKQEVTVLAPPNHCAGDTGTCKPGGPLAESKVTKLPTTPKRRSRVARVNEVAKNQVYFNEVKKTEFTVKYTINQLFQGENVIAFVRPTGFVVKPKQPESDFLLDENFWNVARPKNENGIETVVSGEPRSPPRARRRLDMECLNRGVDGPEGVLADIKSYPAEDNIGSQFKNLTLENCVRQLFSDNCENSAELFDLKPKPASTMDEAMFKYKQLSWDDTPSKMAAVDHGSKTTIYYGMHHTPGGSNSKGDPFNPYTPYKWLEKVESPKYKGVRDLISDTEGMYEVESSSSSGLEEFGFCSPFDADF